MINKSKGIIMADYIIENAIRNLNLELDGWIDAFNNCREQGYIIYLHPTNSWDFKDYLTIYVYAHRNTDKPTITWEYDFGGSLFNQDAWLNRTESFDDLDQAIMQIDELIAEYFKNKIEKRY